MYRTMRAIAGLLAVLVLGAACQSSIPISGATPSPPLSKLQLTCRIPVAAPNAPMDGIRSDGTIGTGGFISFPSGKFTDDPASLGSYDAAVGKWLPVPRAWISPDGRSYAYVANNPDPVLHIVDAATGNENMVAIYSVAHVATAARTTVNPARVIDYDTTGIYLVNVFPNSDATPRGLALVNPVTHAYFVWAPATSQLVVIAVHAGLSYSGSLGTGADAITVDSPIPHFNELEVSQLAPGGGEVGGAYMASSWLQLMGFDGGGQPVMSAVSSTSYRIYTGAMFASTFPAPVFTGKPNDPSNPIGPVVGDGKGIWFTSPSGVIWYYPGGGQAFEKVAVTPFKSPVLAGGCA